MKSFTLNEDISYMMMNYVHSWVIMLQPYFKWRKFFFFYVLEYQWADWSCIQKKLEEYKSIDVNQPRKPSNCENENSKQLNNSFWLLWSNYLQEANIYRVRVRRENRDRKSDLNSEECAQNGTDLNRDRLINDRDRRRIIWDSSSSEI